MKVKENDDKDERQSLNEMFGQSKENHRNTGRFENDKKEQQKNHRHV